MRNSPIILALVSCLVGFTAAPARAGSKEEAWAACLWQKVPTSAGNWLAMKPLKVGDTWDPKNPYAALETRLKAACDEALTPPGKKYSLSFDADKVSKSLARTKPTFIGPDVIEPKAYRCEVYEGDTLLQVSYGIGDWTKVKPRAPADKIKCQQIKSDGSLSDA